MPIHDWTRVGAGIFHHFHFEWIGDLSRVLNQGLLPPNYYALAEQIAGELGLDVRGRSEPEQYAAKARAVVIRRTRGHQIIAILEIVSPGNKSSRHAPRSFVENAVQVLRNRIHLVIIDLFPPAPRNRQNIHKAIWHEFTDSDFTPPSDRPLTLASYIGEPFPKSFVEPIALGATLPEMRCFLTPRVYVPLPLEGTYQSAWEAVPACWPEVLAAPATSS